MTHTSKPQPQGTPSTSTLARQDLLRWVGSLGAVTAQALAIRLDVGLPSARARLSDARRRGLLSAKQPLTESPALFTLTPSGARIGQSAGGTCRVTASNAAHLAACAAVAATLERCYPRARAIGERELRRSERSGERPPVIAPLAALYAGASRGHRPDLVLVDESTEPAARPVAVEVELSVKAPSRLRAICRAWERCRDIAGVLYLASPEAERALSRAVAATGARRIAVVPLCALPDLRRSPRSIPSAD